MDDICEKRCGEIFLSIEGFMIFHCTLCKEKFNEFEIYAAHIEFAHNATIKLFSNLYGDVLSEKSEYIEALKQKNGFTELLEGSLDADIAKLEKVIDEDVDTEYHDYIDNLYSEPSKTAHLKETAFNKAKPKQKAKIQLEDDLKTDTALKTIVTAVIEVPGDSHVVEDVPDNFDPVRPIRKKTNYFASPEVERPHKCPHCDAAFKNYNSFYKHKIRHKTEKNHPCPHPQCSKMFYDAIEVKKHLKLHLGVRTYLCDVCGRAFTASGRLKDHMRRHTNQRDYECHVCKKAFFNSALLKNHTLIHSNNKSFKCTICEAKFRRNTQLKNHLRLHENKREYKCNLCNADFNQLAGLFTHRKTKHRIL